MRTYPSVIMDSYFFANIIFSFIFDYLMTDYYRLYYLLLLYFHLKIQSCYAYHRKTACCLMLRIGIAILRVNLKELLLLSFGGFRQLWVPYHLGDSKVRSEEVRFLAFLLFDLAAVHQTFSINMSPP